MSEVVDVTAAFLLEEALAAGPSGKLVPFGFLCVLQGGRIKAVAVREPFRAGRL